MSELHKRFTSEQAKKLLDRYSKNEIELKYIQEILGIKKRWNLTGKILGVLYS